MTSTVHFKLAVSGAVASLVIPDGATGPYATGAGVAHEGCDVLADVTPTLDSVYCPGCGLNDRVSGAWVMAQFSDAENVEGEPEHLVAADESSAYEADPWGL